MKTQLLRFEGAAKQHPAIAGWFRTQPAPLGLIAARWFDVMRACGEEVRELLHDGRPTACVADAGFAYIDVFATHVNVGFFRGADLPDPMRLLEGSGKHGRHVKLRPGSDVNSSALQALIQAAYVDMKGRVRAEAR